MTHSGSSLTQQTVVGLLWTLYGKGAYAVLQLVVVGVLARFVSPADFGVVSAALIVIGVSTMFSRLGLGPALVQRQPAEVLVQTPVVRRSGEGRLVALPGRLFRFRRRCQPAKVIPPL